MNMAVFNASQVETHFSTVFPSNKSALKSNAGALALRKTNSGFCHCRNTSQFEMHFLYRSMAFGEEGRGVLTLFSKPAHSQDSKSHCQAAFSAYSPLGDKTIRRSSSVKVRPVYRLAGSRAIAEQSPGLDGGRAADYSFGTRGNTLCKGGMRSTDGGVLGGDCVKTLCKRSFSWYNRIKVNEREEKGWTIFRGLTGIRAA